MPIRCLLLQYCHKGNIKAPFKFASMSFCRKRVLNFVFCHRSSSMVDMSDVPPLTSDSDSESDNDNSDSVDNNVTNSSGRWSSFVDHCFYTLDPIITFLLKSVDGLVSLKLFFKFCVYCQIYGSSGFWRGERRECSRGPCECIRTHADIHISDADVELCIFKACSQSLFIMALVLSAIYGHCCFSHPWSSSSIHSLILLSILLVANPSSEFSTFIQLLQCLLTKAL